MADPAAALGRDGFAGLEDADEGSRHLAWILGGGTTGSEVAHRLIDEFGSLGSVIAGSPIRQARVAADEDAVRRLSRFQAAVLHMLRPSGPRRILGDWRSVHDYLRVSMAFDRSERFRALYLDAGNGVLKDLVIGQGTVDRSIVHVREVVGPAIELGATSVVVAHNHPSGDPKPSRHDRQLTRRLGDACALLDLRLLDHIIVGAGGVFSFRSAGLLP